MPEFKIRVEFDVEVDNPSHIDAAKIVNTLNHAEYVKRREAAR